MASFDGTLRVFFIRNSNALAAQLSALNGVVILRAKSKANPARSSLCARRCFIACPSLERAVLEYKADWLPKAKALGLEIPPPLVARWGWKSSAWLPTPPEAGL